MVKYDNEHILFTHGDYYYWPAPQDEKNHLGKIQLINLESKQLRCSKGHRALKGFTMIKIEMFSFSRTWSCGRNEININNLDDNKIKSRLANHHMEHHCKENLRWKAKMV